MAAQILLPGEVIPSEDLPRSKKGTLVLGPGLRHIPPSTLISTASGPLHVDHKKSALWIEHEHGRYQPAIGDLVIAQIHHGGAEHYSCSLTTHTPFALLHNFAFEGANKKTRPQLKAGNLVYARVCRASKWEDTEIECFNSATGKAEGMGQLNDGMLFSTSPGFARRLMMGGGKGGVVLLEELGEKLRFEVAVGRNGKIWIKSGSIKETVLIGKLLQQVEEERLNEDQQKKLVKKALK